MSTLASLSSLNNLKSSPHSLDHLNKKLLRSRDLENDLDKESSSSSSSILQLQVLSEPVEYIVSNSLKKKRAASTILQSEVVESLIIRLSNTETKDVSMLAKKEIQDKCLMFQSFPILDPSYVPEREVCGL